MVNAKINKNKHLLKKLLIRKGYSLATLKMMSNMTASRYIYDALKPVERGFYKIVKNDIDDEVYNRLYMLFNTFKTKELFIDIIKLGVDYTERSMLTTNFGINIMDTVATSGKTWYITNKEYLIKQIFDNMNILKVIKTSYNINLGVINLGII
jgi:hypothetical protein